MMLFGMNEPTGTSKKALEPTPIEPSTVGETAVPAEDPGDGGTTGRSPWWFVPSLYFMQGLPVVVVQTLSVTMYKKMGVSNAEIGLWTSLIAWPWIAKMLWGPLVEGYGTRRSWIIAMQAIIIACLGFAAYSMGMPGFFAISLGIFFVIAFLSATHDIAADGFYLLALREKQQAFFVGIRSTFFRLAMIFGSGILVILAGRWEDQMPIPQTWVYALGVGTAVYAILYLFNLYALPKPAADVARAPVDIPKVLLSFGQIVLMLAAVFLIGRLVVIGAGWTNPLFAQPVFTKSVELTPLFLESYPGQTEHAYASRAEDLLAKNRLDVGLGRADPITPEQAAERAADTPKPFITRNFAVPYPVQLLGALGLIGLAYWSTKRLFARIGMGPAAREYFARDRIVPILAFILFYRFGESMLVKMSSPFLLDRTTAGGMAMTTEAVGVIIGTIGVLGLVLGGLLGGAAIAKWGLKRCIWPMVAFLNVPNIFYVWLAFRRPPSPLSEQIAGGTLPFWNVGADRFAGLLWDILLYIPAQMYNIGLLLWEAIRDPVGQVIVLDQFGYGIGFAAYMVYLMYLSQGAKQQTAHYAISTGLMALGAMIAGSVSGYIQEWSAAHFGATQGYAWFFVIVCLATIPGMLTLLFIPLDRKDMRVRPPEDV
jgi:MFS transporter, PAT family, beta-lactamase induction signal transducer AmpG